ncbi:MAG: oligoribonuclease [Thiotrichales bacterium]|nr:MAG: oligoribonuclease [Thiotrichales bacterium]
MSTKANKTNLVWIDLEMTGLDTDNDFIIEIATVITDSDLNIVAEGPELAIYQPESILAQMDKWNTKHHTQSGLVARVQASTISVTNAAEQTLNFITQYVAKNKSPLCGNSICQDRRFLHRLMPDIERYLHYRNLDVSTIKELAKRWAPKTYNGFKKDPQHRAKDDILDSIAELHYYREHFLSY